MAGRDWSNYDTAQAKNLAYLYDALGLSRLDQVCERLGIAAAPKDYAVDSTSYQNENRSVPLVEDTDPPQAEDPKDEEQLSLFQDLEEDRK